jgi:hypothetical protein
MWFLFFWKKISSIKVKYKLGIKKLMDNLSSVILSLDIKIKIANIGTRPKLIIKKIAYVSQHIVFLKKIDLLTLVFFIIISPQFLKLIYFNNYDK